MLRVPSVALGAVVGTLARVELERLLPAGPGLPWGTFTANIAGCLLLGAGSVLVLERLGATRYVWSLFATGLCGSFTTFSTFAVEVDLRLRSGDVAPGIGYVVASLLAGVGAVLLASGLCRAILGRRALRRERRGGPWR